MSDPKPTLTRESVLRDLDSQWNEFQTYVSSLSEDQLTRPTDAAGWTAKDHIMHIAIFDQAELAILERRSKQEQLDIPEDAWERGEDDEINEILRQRYRDLPLKDVMKTLNDSHERMVKKLTSMTEDDFKLPYSHYQSSSTDQRTILEYAPWDTYYHYRDHLPWIKAIVEKA